MWHNESRDHRAKRAELLQAEAELRDRTEHVARMRRALPDGGPAKEDYEFKRAADGKSVRLSQLFAPGKDSLFAYSFMFGPGGSPCPMCTSLLDGLEKTVPHLTQRINIAVIAKATPGELRDYAASRGWQNLPLFSSGSNTYNFDYRAENADGKQLPIMHVWRRREGEVRHFWASELFYYDNPDWPCDPRHADTIWPLWNVLDLTPEGRGEDWYPRVRYDD